MYPISIGIFPILKITIVFPKVSTMPYLKLYFYSCYHYIAKIQNCNDCSIYFIIIVSFDLLIQAVILSFYLQNTAPNSFPTI